MESGLLLNRDAVDRKFAIHRPEQRKASIFTRPDKLRLLAAERAQQGLEMKRAIRLVTVIGADRRMQRL